MITLSKARDVTDIRERLKQGKLSPDDVKYIDEVLAEYEHLLRMPTDEHGRVLVARLPFGMDIVK